MSATDPIEINLGKTDKWQTLHTVAWNHAQYLMPFYGQQAPASEASTKIDEDDQGSVSSLSADSDEEGYSALAKNPTTSKGMGAGCAAS